ncbi:hypothetical protein TIFTF001_004017 [Ficus carica]|uniref:Uncharacterized protein n=1 Tax=Ficus carica TaxID=3494 RepID=A0AA88CWH6_FICCA|nr:hypothetical protein TIFTF001_004017 [Ficus carica]
MDRRSWLWRRKSSEKSPGETESTGSISSHSERFSDEQCRLFVVTCHMNLLKCRKGYSCLELEIAVNRVIEHAYARSPVWEER